MWYKPNHSLSTGSRYILNFEHILIAWRTNETIVFNWMDGFNEQCSGVIVYPSVTRHSLDFESGEILNPTEKPWQLLFRILRNHRTPQMKVRKKVFFIIIINYNN